jgi:hypothetical protein
MYVKEMIYFVKNEELVLPVLEQLEEATMYNISVYHTKKFRLEDKLNDII